MTLLLDCSFKSAYCGQVIIQDFILFMNYVEDILKLNNITISGMFLNKLICMYHRYFHEKGQFPSFKTQSLRSFQNVIPTT